MFSPICSMQNVEEWHKLFHVELGLVGCGNDKVWNDI